MSLTARQPDLALPDRIKAALPFEMQQLKQWILWELIPNADPNKKADKVPLSLHTLNKIDPTQERFCGTFDQVAGAYLSHVTHRHNIGIGFSLQPHSAPLVAFDLDNYTDAQAYEFFNKEGLPPTYLERSPSGKGFRALYLYPEAGNHASRRNDAEGFEVYTNKRFLTITGNVVANPGVTLVNGEMGKFFERHKASQALGLSANLAELNKPETKTDEEVIAVASRSKHGEEFQRLYSNTIDRSRYNDDQSAIDQAFVNMLQFYSGNVNQIVRIWLGSTLASQRGGKDGPAKLQRRDYILRTVGNAFDRTVPTQPGVIGLQAQIKSANEHLQARRLVENKVEPKPAAQDAKASSLPPLTPPPGLVGEIAKIAMASQFQCTPEYAITAGLSFIAGASGRTHFVKNQSLAVYLLSMGATGTGKETISKVHDLITNHLADTRPNLANVGFFTGMSDVVSVKGLNNHLKEKPSSVSVIGEGTMWLSNLVHAREGTQQYQVYKTLLDLYGKGPGSRIKANTYANKDDNTKEIHSPAFSLVLEGVPHRFYENLDETMIESGMIPRFIPIEYTGGITATNFDAMNYAMPVDAEQRLADYLIHADSLTRQMMAHAMRVPGVPCAVEFTPEAEQMYRSDVEALKKFRNENSTNGIGDLYNRAVVNTIKIAAIVAVGIDWHKPIICPQCYTWARDLIQRGLKPIEDKVRRGAIGENDIAAIEEIKKACQLWCDGASYKYSKFKQLHGTKIVPINYLLQTAGRRALIKKHKLGAGRYLTNMLNLMHDTGDLELYDASVDYNFRGKCIKISE